MTRTQHWLEITAKRIQYLRVSGISGLNYLFHSRLNANLNVFHNVFFFFFFFFLFFFFLIKICPPPPPPPSPTPEPKMSFGGDISMTNLRYIYDWKLGSRCGGRIFITTFMKHIWFCNLTGTEKKIIQVRYTRHEHRQYSFSHNFLSVLCFLHSGARNISQRGRLLNVNMV